MCPPQPSQKPPTEVLLPSKVTAAMIRDPAQFGRENHLNQLPSLIMQDPLHQLSLGSSMSFPRGDRSTSNSNVNSTLSESHGWPPSESRDENDAIFVKSGSGSRFKLFGFSLIDDPPELPSQQFANFSKVCSPPISPISEKTCKKCRSNRSCTKVL